MKHFPATRSPVRIDPTVVCHVRRPVMLRRSEAALCAALCFVAGFALAVWTVGVLLTAR